MTQGVLRLERRSDARGHLLAIDGSPSARRAAELVRRLADGGAVVVVLHLTEIMPIHGAPGTTVDLDRDRSEGRRFGRELEHAGMPTKLELVRAFAGHVARIILEATRDHQAG